MKNNILSLCLLCLMGVCFSSCELIKQLDDETDDRITVFNDAHKNISFNPSQSSIDVNIISSVPWRARSNADWCRVNPVSGQAGNSKVQISADVNKEKETRKAEVRFTAGSAELVIRVSQVGLQSRSLVITHKSEEFTAPIFTGVHSGTVNWGDEVIEDVMSVEEHKYTTPGEKEVSFDLWGEKGAIQVELHGIKDVLRIDLSGLRE